jgi:tetratricopeptide (TPR) repeat protein
MNAYARNSNLPELRLVDDADASCGSVAPEEDLASLPTLPRFPAKHLRPSNSAAANAPEMASPPTASPLELSLEPIAEHRPPRAPMPYVAPAPVAAVPSGVTPMSPRGRPEGESDPERASAKGSPMNASTITPAGAAERYLAEATLELEAGQVDQPLWMRAVTQANGDEAAARTAYLKARATAIRMARREVQHERAERRMRVLGELPPEPRAAVAGRGFAGLVTRNRIIAAAVGGAVVLAGAWFVLSDPAPSRAVAAAAPQKVANGPSGAAKSPAQATATVPGGAAASSPESERTQAQVLATKVAELSAAGNWNVLVLHATEWTRKDPNNADAWLALGTGFSRLKQHAEAAEALAKATTLAPERPEVWRGLGEAKAAWGATDEAIIAFERAVAMDDRDIASIVQIGLLQAGTGDLAKAKDTLDRALALNPADVEALCGSAAVAQKAGRAKDGQAHARQAASLGAACPEAAPEPPTTPVRVVGGKPPATPAIARR